MAQPAYDLNNFAPERRSDPGRRVEKRRRQRPQQSTGKRVYQVCTLALVLLLVVGVLNTQAKLTEVQGGITRAQRQLHEAQAIYDSLNLTLESTVNVKTVEERAKALGLVKMDPANVNYVRARDGNSIEVAKTGLSKWLEGAQTGFLDIVQYYMPR